jgi:tRNA(fMet)-specific endonuclease VapC
MFLLDTNTLIYFFKGQGRVAERLLATSPAEVAIASPED